MANIPQGSIYHPTYLIHPETKRICDANGIKLEFDPVNADSEMRAYKDRFLSQRPNPETPITGKITEITRLRKSDRRMEFLVWTENQSFIDALGNDVPFTRTFCGIYKIPKVHTKTTSDGAGGVKTEVDSYSWLTMYEVPFNEENVKKARELAEDEYQLKLYIQTEGIEEVWAFHIEDFEKWAKWSFNSLLEYARTPQRFGRDDKNLEPYNPPLPDQTKKELFEQEINKPKKK